MERNSGVRSCIEDVMVIVVIAEEGIRESGCESESRGIVAVVAVVRGAERRWYGVC